MTDDPSPAPLASCSAEGRGSDPTLFRSLVFAAFVGLAGCSKNSTHDGSTTHGDAADKNDAADNDAADEDSGGTPPPDVLPPRNSARVYWVGHSLVTGNDPHQNGALPLPELLRPLVEAAGQTYAYYEHTTPGAPLGWNWGATDDAWGDVEGKFQPLIDPGHADYGSFDAMVITESIPVTVSKDAWSSGFYARRFFCAALRANPNVELFLYESWPHFQVGDPEYASVYGPPESWDFLAFLRAERKLWVEILGEAADPGRTPASPDGYRWRGPGEDPGECGGSLSIRLIPTGTALAVLLERIEERRAGDDWSFAAAAVDGTFSALDLWLNPLRNFPTDRNTTVHEGEMDDIHPSHALVYFNALVHYSVVYRRNPVGIPASNGVPDNVATIMKEVAWNAVLDDPRTGVSAKD